MSVEWMLLSQGEESYQAGERALKQRRARDAVQFFCAAERLGYPACECAAALWNCWMMEGQFELAWQQSDRIAAMGLPDPNRFWNGEPWEDRHVMVRCLHGLGDAIQFIRYAPLLRATARRLTVQAPPQLVRLMGCVEGVDRVITWEEPEGDWDLQMEVIELPRAFRSTLETLPREVPYVKVPMGGGRRGGPRRIGLHWQAGEWNAARSIPVELFRALIRESPCEFYSLQKGVEAAPLRMGLRDLEIYATDVRDTAESIMDLDLVISVDTMTAHLAGALGKPVWVLLPYAADWRWMTGRSDSPWYPTARLFRQRRPGEWASVMAEVATWLWAG